RRPTVGLLVSLTATMLAELPARRRALGRTGRLRRLSLLRATATTPIEIDEELALGPRVLAALLGNETIEPHDPLEIPPRESPLPLGVDSARVQQLVEGLRDATVAVVGVWGPRHAEHATVVHALGTGLRRR